MQKHKDEPLHQLGSLLEDERFAQLPLRNTVGADRFLGQIFQSDWK